MRSDGGFIIKGRVVDAMRFKVFAKVHYPAPVEEALGAHPNIRDVSVSSQVKMWELCHTSKCTCSSWLITGVKPFFSFQLLSWTKNQLAETNRVNLHIPMGIVWKRWLRHRMVAWFSVKYVQAFHKLCKGKLWINFPRLSTNQTF